MQKELREEWLSELNQIIDKQKIPTGDARLVEEILELGLQSYENKLREN